MKVKTLAVAAGVCAPLILTGSSDAGFTGVTVTGKPNPFSSALSIPMAPFTALKGVDRTAGAIHSVGRSVEHISDIIEELPESARWQLLLLLLEMGDTEVVKTVVSWWGPSVCDGSGRLDRQRIAEVIFADPQERRRLEQLVNTRIAAQRERLI